MSSEIATEQAKVILVLDDDFDLNLVDIVKAYYNFSVVALNVSRNGNYPEIIGKIRNSRFNAWQGSTHRSSIYAKRNPLFIQKCLRILDGSKIETIKEEEMANACAVNTVTKLNEEITPNEGLLKLITNIRNSHPDMLKLYMEGQCYNFAKILVESGYDVNYYYNFKEEHFYVTDGYFLYDIRGLHYPDNQEDFYPIGETNISSHPVEEWGKNDPRRLVMMVQKASLSHYSFKTKVQTFIRNLAVKVLSKEL